MSLLDRIQEQTASASKNIGHGATSYKLDFESRAKDVAPQPKDAPRDSSEIARYEWILYWDAFCTHKKFIPGLRGQKKRGVNRRCTKPDCAKQRLFYRELLTEEYRVKYWNHVWKKYK